MVVITLDTTRADRLSVYGYPAPTTPHLERLASEGIAFENAISVAPLTLPAHCSLFTGLYPPAHGVRDNTDRPLSPEHVTLAEILRERGFRTAAFVGSAVLERDRGLARGFDRYVSVADMDAGERAIAPPQQRRADAVVADAIRWIDELQDPQFFLWLHLYDPHRPYEPPEPFRSRYADPYDGEIAFVDAQVGRVVDALTSRKFLDRSIVVVAADHGESLGDHGERDHGIFVYESVVHVPLIVRAPDVSRRRIDEIVRLVDVMPTVLELLGVAGPPVDGVSLLGMMRGDSRMPELLAYSESQYPLRFGWSAVRAVRSRRYKLIDAPRRELYDLARDPYEQRNIYKERHGVAAALAQQLTTIDARSRAAEATVRSGPRDLRERLASLGYVGSNQPPSSAGHRNLPDPKDCIVGFPIVNRAFDGTQETPPRLPAMCLSAGLERY